MHASISTRSQWKAIVTICSQTNSIKFKMMKLLHIVCMIILQQARAQQQSNKTYSALDTLISSSNSAFLGPCTIDTHTEVTCMLINRMTVPNVFVNLSTIITFLPCQSPISVRIDAATSDVTILNETFSESQNVMAPNNPIFIEMFNVMLNQIDAGISFGVTATAFGQTVPLFMVTDIPFQCNVDMETTNTEVDMATASAPKMGAPLGSALTTTVVGILLLVQ